MVNKQAFLEADTRKLAARITRTQRAHLQQSARDQKAISSLESFARQAWASVKPGRRLEWSWHLTLLCREAQDFTRPIWDPEVDAPAPGENELVVCVPPRSLKSYLMTVCLPAWLWIHAPHAGIQGISNAQKLSVDLSVASQELVRSPWYQRLLRHKQIIDSGGEDQSIPWGVSKRQAEKANYKNTVGGERFAFGVDGHITGTGADLQLVDDPYDAKDATRGTPDAVAKRMAQMESDYDDVWSRRLNDPTRGLRLTIMQRLDPGDLAGVLIRRGARCVVLPLEYDPGLSSDLGGVHPDDPRTEPGELLMPTRWPAWWAAKAKERASWSFEAQYNQRPSRKEGGLFKDRHFEHRYPDDPHLLKVDRIAIFVDCTFKKTTDGSFFCAQVWGQRGRNWHALLDQRRARVSFSESLVILSALCASWPRYYAVYVEAKANGDATVSAMKDEIRGLTEWEPGVASKYERAEVGSEPVFGAGQAHFPTDERCQWMVGYKKRHIAFDGKKRKNAPDDEIDTSSMAMLKVAGRKRSPLEKLRESLPRMRGGS